MNEDREEQIKRKAVGLLGFSGLCLVAAWLAGRGPLMDLLRPGNDGVVRASREFFAVGYGDDSWRADEKPEDIVAGHVADLAEHGFRPASPAAVEALLHKGRLLPERSVLLTFDGVAAIRLSAIRTALENAGWSSAFFVSATGAARSASISFRQAGGSLALNSEGSDAMRLNRLHITPEFSAKTSLVARLDAEYNFRAPVALPVPRRATWAVRSGDAAFRDGLFQFAATKPGVPAEAWLAVPLPQGNADVMIRFGRLENPVYFAFRGASSTGAVARILLEPNGTASFETASREGAAFKPGAKGVFAPSTNATRLLTLAFRDARLFANLDGRPLFDHGIRMDFSRLDALGIGARDAGITKGWITLSSVSISPQAGRLAWWSTPVPEHQVANWMGAEGGQYTIISPPLDLKTSTNNVMQTLVRIAHACQCEIAPRIVLRDSSDMAVWSGGKIRSTIASLGCDGLMVDVALTDGVAGEEMKSWLDGIQETLRSSASRIFLLLMPNVADPAAMNQILTNHPSITLLGRQGDAQTALVATDVSRLIADLAPGLNAQLVIPANTAALTSDDIPGRIRALRQEGQDAFYRGDYEAAVLPLYRWHELEPRNPESLNMIGDALRQLGRTEESVEYFRQSLETAPGQLPIVARLTGIYGDLHREEEARSLLNLYVRLFPDEPSVLLAQAGWLVRHARFEEAEPRLRSILDAQPMNFDALTLYLQCAEDGPERKAAMMRLVETGKKSPQPAEFVRLVSEYDFLTLPRSDALSDLFSLWLKTSEEPLLKDRLRRLVNRPVSVNERLAGGATFSPAWTLEGGNATAGAKGLHLACNTGRMECRLRLSQTERWHDSFIEATISEIKQGVWLYLLKSVDNIARFGIDAKTGRLHLQVWSGRNSRLIVNQTQDLPAISTGLKLRVEARGNSLRAYVNGELINGGSIELPSVMEYGWAGIACVGAEPGKASVVVEQISAGPLPIRMAVLPPTPADKGADQELAVLRAASGQISDICPAWFKIGTNTTWESTLKPEDDFFRLFARYYHLRFMPLVEIAPNATVRAADIAEITHLHHLDGVTLCYKEWPAESVMTRLSADLLETGIPVIAIRPEGGENAAGTVRPLGQARVFFQDDVSSRHVPFLSGNLKTDGALRNVQGCAVIIYDGALAPKKKPAESTEGSAAGSSGKDPSSSTKEKGNT